MGVIRITIEEPPEPKVTKVPSEYNITLKDKRQEKEKKPPAKSAAKKAAKSKKAENGDEATAISKEEKEEIPIALLVVNKGARNVKGG